MPWRAPRAGALPGRARPSRVRCGSASFLRWSSICFLSCSRPRDKGQESEAGAGWDYVPSGSRMSALQVSQELGLGRRRKLDAGALGDVVHHEVNRRDHDGADRPWREREADEVDSGELALLLV